MRFDFIVKGAITSMLMCSLAAYSGEVCINSECSQGFVCAKFPASPPVTHKACAFGIGVVGVWCPFGEVDVLADNSERLHRVPECVLEEDAVYKDGKWYIK